MPLADAARRYVAWLERRIAAIIATSAVVLAAAIYLIAFHLPLYADFSYLLPQDAPAVRDLRELSRRLVSKDTTIVLVVAPDAATRAAAADELIAGLRTIDKDLIERLDIDNQATRDYLRAHRHLLVPLEDLIAARDELGKRIDDAKLHANPLFVDLDEPRPEQVRKDKQRLDELRKKRRDAEAWLDRSSNVSADGRTALIVIKTGFIATDVNRARRLLSDIEAIGARVRAAHPTVTIGLTGGAPTAVAEQGALIRGMVLSSLVTGVLVALVLLLHLRSLALLALITLNIVVATVVAFGLAALTVGHLNAATAFLGAIIAGNGVNYGILLAARFLEERRVMEPTEAMAVAITGTLRPTLVAALGASIAYGALASTSFKGFADFALIGGAGMIACWISSYVVLPALVLRFARKVRSRERPSVFSRFVGVFRVRRPIVACVVAAAVSIGAGVATWRYIVADPFEYDMTKLRSEAPDAIAARHWMKVADETFGRGIWSSTYIAVDRPEQVAGVVAKLRAIQATSDGRATMGSIFSILDVVPADQPRKLEVLAEIRKRLDDPGLDALADADREELLELRPPDDLRPTTTEDLPAELKVKLTERSGVTGNLIAIRPAATFDDLDGHDLLQFAAAVRSLRSETGDSITTSGASLIFADIIATIQRDGPIVTVVAAIALVIMVVLVVGRNRRALAVLIGTFTGSLAMIAVCAVVGVRINFLDFIALPITLGLGVDYAINVADRADRDDPLVALEMTGATVLVCSLTTLIGYASLLVSANLAIRGFGLASLIGEVTCVITALTLVPAIVSLGRQRKMAAS